MCTTVRPVRVVAHDNATSIEACGPSSPTNASLSRVRKIRNALMSRAFWMPRPNVINALTLREAKLRR